MNGRNAQHTGSAFFRLQGSFQNSTRARVKASTETADSRPLVSTLAFTKTRAKRAHRAAPKPDKT